MNSIVRKLGGIKEQERLTQKSGRMLTSEFTNRGVSKSKTPIFGRVQQESRRLSLSQRGKKEHQFAIRLLFPTTVCGQQESEKKYEEYSTLVIDLTDTKTGDGWTVQKWKKFYCDDNEYKKWVWNTKIEEKKKELEKERKKILKQASQVRWLEEKEHSREPRRIERELTMEYEEMIQRKDRL